MRTQEQREAKKQAEQNAAFTSWLNRPETRLILSLCPPAETHEAMQTILRGAFEAGYSSGMGAMAGEMIDAMLSRKDKGE